MIKFSHFQCGKTKKRKKKVFRLTLSLRQTDIVQIKFIFFMKFRNF